MLPCRAGQEIREEIERGLLLTYTPATVSSTRRRSEDFYVNKLGSLFRERKVS
jgi:hypothetical protein